MVEYTLLDKIGLAFNLITNSPLFLILILGITLMIIDILYISKKDSKTKKMYFIISIVIVILFINSYLSSLLSIFDSIAKNVVAIIYFPSVLEYILMLLITIIIMFISAINKKISKFIKRVNAFILIINSFLFLLIIDQISKSNVDLENKISIYTNSNLTMLIELSILIFALWIIFLILYKVIKKVGVREPDLPKLKDEKASFYQKPVLPETFSELQKPDPKIEYIVIEKPKSRELFTLEEYKRLKEYLEEMKTQNKK